jgi:hypothetical protein
MIVNTNRLGEQEGSVLIVGLNNLEQMHDVCLIHILHDMMISYDTKQIIKENIFLIFF